MRREHLFLGTLKELDQRLKSPEIYDVLMTAGLLRKLLLDGGALVDLVNRTRRMKIVFLANNPDLDGVLGLLDEPPFFWAIQDGIDPGGCPMPREPLALSSKDFLALSVMYLRGERFSVADLIRYVANVAGAVHAGLPKDKSQESLAGLDEHLAIMGGPPTIRSLLGIGRVVVRALQPLKQRVEADLAGDTGDTSEAE